MTEQQVHARLDVKEDTSMQPLFVANADTSTRTVMGQVQLYKAQLDDTTQRVLPLSIQKRRQGLADQQGLYLGKTLQSNVIEGDIILSESPLILYLASNVDLNQRLQRLSSKPIPISLYLTFLALQHWKTMEVIEEVKRTYYWQNKQMLLKDDKFTPFMNVLDHMVKVFKCTKEQVISLWNTVAAYQILLRGHHVQGVYGAALYRFSSMLNHSCDPNAEWVFQSNGTITIQAIRTMNPNAEITTCYLPALSVMERHQRQQLLYENDLLADGRCVCRRCREELMYDPNTAKKVSDGPSDWEFRSLSSDRDCVQILEVAGAKEADIKRMMNLHLKLIHPVEVWKAHWKQFRFFKHYFEEYPVQLWTLTSHLLYKMFWAFGSVKSTDLGDSKEQSEAIMEEFATFLEARVFPLFSDKSLEDFNRTSIERHRRICPQKPNLLESVDFKDFPMNADGITITCTCGQRVDHYLVGLTNMNMTPALCRQYSHRHFMYLMFTILTVIGKRVDKIDRSRVSGWAQTLGLIADDKMHAAYMQSNANRCTYHDCYPPVVSEPK